MSSCPGSCVGVGILINNNFDFDIKKTCIDPLVRFIILGIKADIKLFTIANSYAPNEDCV